MKIRWQLFIPVCLIALMISLCALAFLARHDRNLLLALPKDISSRGADIFDLDEFSKNDFLLTYEIPYPDKFILPHAEFPVIVIGTTSSLQNILKYIMIEGSFFTYQAWAGKLKQAVLNEKAAFSIFGSNNVTGNRFKMKNDTWIVTGVIKDGDDDHSRVYIPSSVRGGEAFAFAMLSTDTLDETMIKNGLKKLEIRESDFYFYNFYAQIRRLCERVEILILCFTGLLFLTFIRPLALISSRNIKDIKAELERSYPGDIFLRNKKLIVKTVITIFGLVLFPGLALALFINTAAICLPWQDLPSINKLSINYFHFHLERMYYIELFSRILFFITIGIICFLLILINVKINKKAESRNT